MAGSRTAPQLPKSSGRAKSTHATRGLLLANSSCSPHGLTGHALCVCLAVPCLSVRATLDLPACNLSCSYISIAHHRRHIDHRSSNTNDGWSRPTLSLSHHRSERDIQVGAPGSHISVSVHTAAGVSAVSSRLETQSGAHSQSSPRPVSASLMYSEVPTPRPKPLADEDVTRHQSRACHSDRQLGPSV